MTKYEEHLGKAKELGREDGEAAASWYWDRTELQEKDYQLILKGIEDGDPEIMDTLPHPDLSGEMADGMTPQKLYELIGVEDNWAIYVGESFCTEYEEAFSDAVQERINRDCTENLREPVKLVIEVNIEKVTPDTLSRWAAKVHDAAAESKFVSIDDVYVENEDEERIW